MKEKYFNHAVICLIDYEIGETSMGIVMNKMTNYTLSDLISTVTRKEPIPIYCGGPMSCDRLYFIHTLGDII
ncbi:YqgE/AlgH family protein, partial [uncultured Muribaculum sp.]